MCDTSRLPATIPKRDIIVSWLESFCQRVSSSLTKPMSLLTALSSPKFPCVAKWALKDAFELPAATPHRERSTLERLRINILEDFGNAGERQSRIMAASLNISAANLYILHSGSRDVPSLCAKIIVAILPMLSWSTERRSAAVGDACESPTPIPEGHQHHVPSRRFRKRSIPSSTARDDNNPAIELEKACNES